MGRLENFIPKCQKMHFQDSGDHTYASVKGGEMPLTLPTRIIPFLKLMTGNSSLCEILLLLDKKNERVNIIEALMTLRQLAYKKFLINGDAFLKIFDADGEESSIPPTPNAKHIKAGYFSKERLLGLVQKTTLFMSCERDTAERILKNASLELIASGKNIIRQGTRDSHFYILLSGRVGVFRLGKSLAELTPLSIFGESAAIFEQSRNADVTAVEESWVLKVNASKLMDTTSGISYDLFNSLKSRLILNQTLASNPLFRDLPTDVLQLFLSQCKIEKHPKERVIVQQRSKSRSFYFILKGSVSILKDGMPVTSLKEGEYFGEVSALFNQPRTASVISEAPCIFLSLSASELYKVLCNNFRLAMDIEHTAHERRESRDNIFTMLDERSKNNEFSAANYLSDKFEDHLISDQQLVENTCTSYDMQVLDFSEAEEDGEEPVLLLQDEEAS